MVKRGEINHMHSENAAESMAEGNNWKRMDISVPEEVK